MLIYPKTKKGVQKDSPVWKEDNFLRLRGLADALVHKTDFKTEDGKNVLAGAYYERVRRELETLEAAKLAQLSKSLGPKAAALKAMPEPTGGSSNSSTPSSAVRRTYLYFLMPCSAFCTGDAFTSVRSIADSPLQCQAPVRCTRRAPRCFLRTV